MSAKDVYCPIPWMFQAVRNNGDVRICCQANVTSNQGVVRKSDGTSYNAGRDSMDEARNGELMKIVRKNILEGRWSEECGRCKKEEDAGLRSRRQYEQEWGFKLEDAIRITQEDGTIETDDTPLVYYDLRFGNLCNLKCTMCNPLVSSKIAAEQKRLGTLPRDWEGPIIIDQSKKMDMDKFRDDLKKILPTR